jgi:hypothetical protein
MNNTYDLRSEEYHWQMHNLVEAILTLSLARYVLSCMLNSRTSSSVFDIFLLAGQWGCFCGYQIMARARCGLKLFSQWSADMGWYLLDVPCGCDRARLHSHIDIPFVTRDGVNYEWQAFDACDFFVRNTLVRRTTLPVSFIPCWTIKEWKICRKRFKCYVEFLVLGLVVEEILCRDVLSGNSTIMPSYNFVIIF